MVEIIPEAVLQHLPFSCKPFSEWGDSTDLLEFLYTLNDVPGEMISSDGTPSTINYRHYGRTIYDQGRESIQTWTTRFASSAQKALPAPGAVSQNINIPDFSNDLEFSKAAKYLIAWDGVTDAVLSDSAFFSIAHVLESDIDLDCSVHLAASLYYRQALQLLRNFLEDVILPIYFCDNRQAFVDWRDNGCQTPRMRGGKGLLNNLMGRRILSEDIIKVVSDLYGELNGCIHGSERRLINKGFGSASWMGFVFKYDDFSEWCRYLCISVDLGIRLLRTNVNQWLSSRPSGKVFCDICHNEDEFDSRESESAGKRYIEYHCRRCGNDMTHVAQDE